MSPLALDTQLSVWMSTSTTAFSRFTTIALDDFHVHPHRCSMTTAMVGESSGRLRR